MDIESDSPTVAGESEIDFSLIQLLETSGSFRRWFVSQATPELEIEEYIGGVIQKHYAGEGESDIEFGFRTAAGTRHIVLVENKVNASFQPEQVERYHNRGQFRVDRETWDSFSVCLLAPERYVSQQTRNGFDSVIHYEDIVEQLQSLPHDSAGFFQSVFESTEQKSVTTDARDVLEAIGRDFRDKTDLTELYQSVDGYKKRISFRSNHQDHPDSVQYDVYIATAGDGGWTAVRLQLLNDQSLTDKERETLESVIEQNIDLLDGYDVTLGREMKNVAAKQIGHVEAAQDPRYESYAEAIANELDTLSETFHPLFVESPVGGD